MNDVLDFRRKEGKDLELRVALSDNVRKVTELITARFEPLEGGTFKNEFEGTLAFSKKNATTSVRALRTNDKLIITLKKGDQIVFPDGIELGVEKVFINLRNKKMVEIPFEILTLE